MDKEYTRIEMLEWLKGHYKKNGYKPDSYSKEFLPARVALYCSKTKNNKIVEEIIVEPTTDESLSIEYFFPTLHIPNVEMPEAPPVRIPGASPVRFYQYYFPNAKIFFAYPDYAKENDKFNEFKEFCQDKGIGLLKTSEARIEEVVSACSSFDKICDQLVEADKSRKKIEHIVSEHLESNLHYLVYYPEPVYTRRAITGREEDAKGVISFCLIDKQQELKKIVYNGKLKELASRYRQEADSDYDIAEKYTKFLWKKYLGLEYPNIQKRVENILQRDEVYREHFVHQFQVFLIGAYILDNMYPEIAMKFYKKHKCRIEKVWLAASTFHDFNYGLQNFDTWLVQFFEDTLRVKNGQTKEKLNLLNMDSAMIRESLYDKIVKMTSQLKSDWNENEKENLIRFFYEKAVRDRNHGVLSAISLLKIFDESNENERKIKMKGILESAIAIGCHDEDIWESLCGCQGYRRSSGKLPSGEDDCLVKCTRELLLWSSKKSRIYKEKIAEDTNKNSAAKFKCENWEREIMCRRNIKKIKFEDYPILFLLIFCDSIQDEGRITSSDNASPLDLSKLVDVFITTEKNEILTNVNLESNNAEKKKDEIERVAWCLDDDRFRVSINGTLKKMDGNGGG